MVVVRKLLPPSGSSENYGQEARVLYFVLQVEHGQLVSFCYISQTVFLVVGNLQPVCDQI